MLRVFGLQVSSRFFRHRALLSITAFLLLASVMAYGQQPLGDVARENREKQTDPASPPPKVITNADLPKNPDGYTGPPANEGEAPSPEQAEASRQAAEQREADQRAAEQWRRRILTQENTVANLQARVARLRASIHFVDPNATYDYYSGLAYNRQQARQMERLNQLQQQLEQQKRKLENLQEAARHAGMHTPVYDP